MITIGELSVGDPADAWRGIGFDVDGDVCHVGTVRLRLGGDVPGIASWMLAGIPESTAEVDGLATRAATTPPANPTRHPNGVIRIDHVVLMTPDLPRTTAALASLGLQVRRERDAGAFAQVFFRLGEVILELVGPKESGTGPAHLWGLTFAVDDIDATAELLGDRIGRVKDAVQPGRRITTLRAESGGVSPAVAFMTPHPEHRGQHR